MKLRLHGNSLRFRISAPELAALLASGRIEETTRLAAQPGASLSYSLVCHVCDSVEVHPSAGEIAIFLPWTVARKLAREEEVSISANINVGGEMLLVLVEKDFACINGTDEENRDTFPNPKQHVTH
jgi:Family of unknown function (DUF7009)